MKRSLVEWSKIDGVAFSTARLKRKNAGLGELTRAGWMLTAAEWEAVKNTGATIRKNPGA